MRALRFRLPRNQCDRQRRDPFAAPGEAESLSRLRLDTDLLRSNAQIGRDIGPAPNLKALLGDSTKLKIFHFARFDLGMLYKALGVMPQPVYCTKIASKLTRTYTDKHGLKDLTKDLLGKDVSKQQQLSDWGAETLTEAQVAYAADDVLNLHALKEKLDTMLAREGRAELAAACFGFLPTRARLDLAGWAAEDIFAHS